MKIFESIGRMAVLALVLWATAGTVWAQQGLVDPEKMPGPLQEVRFDQQLGADIPLDAQFIDEDGRNVVLGDLFDERPVVMAFVYYECPMLCTIVMNGLAKSLGVLKFDVGQEFDVVAISIDPGETPAMATQAKTDAVHRYGREATAEGWHFLTGSEEQIRRVTDVAGFHYNYLPETGEYAHAGGILVVTPQGQIAQYFYGIDYPPKDLRLALVESADERIGSVVDQILLYCYQYDPALGKYTAVVQRILRLTGIVFLLAMGLFFWINLRRDRAAAHSKTPNLGAV